MYKSSKQNMFEHILKGTIKNVVYVIKVYWILPATMERE